MPVFVVPLLQRVLRSDTRRARRLFIAQQRSLTAKLERAVRRVRAENRHRRPRVVGHVIGGALTSPRDVTVYLMFRDRNALKHAQDSGYTLHLRRALLEALRRDCYPHESLNAVNIGFLGKREVDAAGGAWEYLRRSN